MKKKLSLTSTIILIVFLSFFVIFPLIKMLFFLTEIDVLSVIKSDRFITGLINSLVSTTVATFISVSLALALAWCLERCKVKFKAFWSFLFIIPMLIPSISHGTGLVILFGRNGIITNLLGLETSIYGFWGVVLGSVLYSFPVAFLMLSDILKYEDSSPYEAANVLGISKVNQIKSIFIPYIRKPMIAIIFAIFTQIVTDYGVPLMVGGKYTTLPVIMYQDVIGMLDFGKGAIIGVVLLVPAIIAFVIDSLNKDKGNSVYSIKMAEKRGTVLPTILCVVVGLFVILPIISFIIMAFVKNYPLDMSLTLANIERAFSMNAGRFLMNSLIIAALVSVIGTATTFISSYFTTRNKTKASIALHLMSILTLAIPGIVLGLSYVLFFRGSFLTGTLTILIVVNLMHFFASPYLMMYNTLNKINPNLENVGETLGLSKVLIVKDVIIPQSKNSLIEMATYFFVNSMMTISAVSFLSSSKTQPISLMIPMFEAQMLIECIGVVSLIILTINVAIKLIVKKVVKEI